MAKKEKKPAGKFEFVKSLAIAVGLALLFRSLLFEPFNIPSGSMKSTLLEGDYVFVTKYAYGYSRYSFPFGLPLFEGRVFGGEPERGDVVVFRKPSNTSVNFIKRLVGLPGDKIQVMEGLLYINGKLVQRKKVADFVDDVSGQVVPRYVETLPNGVSYVVLDEKQGYGAADNTPVFTVPEGYYFFLGDNRDNSQDSRFEKIGYVPEENLLGPARVIFFSNKSSLWRPWEWIISFRGNRFWGALKVEDS